MCRLVRMSDLVSDEIDSVCLYPVVDEVGHPAGGLVVDLIPVPAQPTVAQPHPKTPSLTSGND